MGLLQWNFLLFNAITSDFITSPHLNYCNNYDVIAIFFFCCDKHFFFL